MIKANSQNPNKEIVNCPKCLAKDRVSWVPGGWYVCSSCHDNFTQEFFDAPVVEREERTSSISPQEKTNHYVASSSGGVKKLVTGVANGVASILSVVIRAVIYSCVVLSLFILIWVAVLGLIGVFRWSSSSHEAFSSYINSYLGWGVAIGVINGLMILSGEKPKGHSRQFSNTSHAVQTSTEDAGYGALQRFESNGTLEPSFNIDGTPMMGSFDMNGNPYGITSTDDHFDSHIHSHDSHWNDGHF